MGRMGQLRSMIVEVAQATPSRVQFRREAMKVVDRAIGYTDSMFHLLDAGEPFERGAFATEVTRDVIVDASERWRSRYNRELAPLWELAARQGGVVVDTLALGPDSRRRLRFYSEIVARTPIAHFMWCPLRLHGELLAYVTIARRDRGRGFTAADQETLRGLCGTLAVADACYRAAPRTLDDELASRLTTREREIVELVVRGFTNPEIALALHRSLHTVRNHLNSVFRKVDVTTRAELAGLAAARPT